MSNHIMFSKYNIIQFVLDVVPRVHDDEWQEWFQKVSRMFNHKIPQALLDALSKKNDILKQLCQEHLATLKYSEPIKDKHAEWIKRRDAGNERVAQQRRLDQMKKAEEKKMLKMLEDEIIVEEVRSHWNYKLQMEEAKRQEFIDNLYRL